MAQNASPPPPPPNSNSGNFWPGQPKKRCKDNTFFSTLHPLSPVIFATAAVVAFVLLHNRFNFHCYTQREATPSEIGPELTVRPFPTSCAKDYKGYSLSRANQLHWTAQSCAKDYKGHSLVQTSFTVPPNRSRDWEAAASLSGRVLSSRCFTLCTTMEVEPRIAKQYKCHHCCSCKRWAGLA